MGASTEAPIFACGFRQSVATLWLWLAASYPLKIAGAISYLKCRNS